MPLLIKQMRSFARTTRQALRFANSLCQCQSAALVLLRWLNCAHWRLCAGQVTDVHVPEDRENGRPRCAQSCSFFVQELRSGFAFVTFANDRDADGALCVF